MLQKFLKLKTNNQRYIYIILGLGALFLFHNNVKILINLKIRVYIIERNLIKIVMQLNIIQYTHIE